VAKDSSKYVKRATIARLNDTAALAALGVSTVYPMQAPAGAVRPFVKYGAPINTPVGASCMDGGDVVVAIHNFTETRGTGAQTVPGEDAASDINAAIAEALDGATIDLQADHGCPYPATAHYLVTNSQVLQDNAEATRFHGFVSLRVTVNS
jgi:hypothetical protein